MSDIDMGKVMSDLKRLASQAQAHAVNRPDIAQNTGPLGELAAGNQRHDSFSSLLQDAIDAVNDAQVQSTKLKKAFEVGDPNVDLPQVMVASQKANVAFTAMLEVRSQLLKAYQDVMSMPV